MNSGMHKPPLAPKPKLVHPHRPGLSPSMPRRDGFSSPGTPRRVKPALAPKPCLSKLTAAVETKPVTPGKTHQALGTESPRLVGLLNSQNGIQQENKKPDWDYIIPICLCSEENCLCIRNNNLNKIEKDLKMQKARTEESGKADNAKCQATKTASTNAQLTNHKPLRETSPFDRNLNAVVDPSGLPLPVRPPLPTRTWSDEANGNVVPLRTPGPEPEEEPKSRPAQQPRAVPAGPRKPAPVPVPRKPQKALLTRQEKVEEEREETGGQEGKQTAVPEPEVSAEGKGGASSSVSAPAGQDRLLPTPPARNACPPPAPPPRKKPYLSTPERAHASTPMELPKDVLEEDLGWDCGVYEMEISVDREDEEVGKEGRDDREAAKDLAGGLPSGGPQRVDSQAAVKLAPKKPQRHSSPMAWTQRMGSSEESQDKGPGAVFKEKVMKGLPSPPDNRARPRAAAKPSRSGTGKLRAKSFSGADLIHAEAPRRTSFRKLLDLKLTVKLLPKLIVKGAQSSDAEQDRPRSFHELSRPECSPPSPPCPPLIGVEQSVDGDELPFGFEPGGDYENVPHYEEIPDYMNVDVGGSATAAAAVGGGLQGYMYDDEGIYEEQEPYMYPAKPPLQRQSGYDSRSSVDEDAAPLLDGASDDDITAHSSDEEDDNSSVSSRDPEQAEESVTQNGPKKSKIHHIATEIMSSERVFVDVLKLLHVDFRDVVSRASRQNGKPVIEDRLLNQILYSLPQLYELNQDLLRELQLRLDKWDDNAQIADIFLKKGPYLKMYSTYIREFDKNAALLEEQCKKSPAFSAVVREFEAGPRCAKLALRHYLLKPVQRIPQYQLLLTDYLKNLSVDSMDYKDTEAALAIVKEVANHANDIMKQGDNFQKLIQVQCSLNGHHEIVQPGRIFLKEGILNKLSRKVMQPRKFFLFNDTLLYTTPVQSGQYKVNNMLSLAGMRVSKPSQEAYQNELNIESVERSFILSASSAMERDDWLEAISTAISDYTRKKISFISGKSLEEVDLSDSGDGAPLGSKAPIWIPDPRTTMCMICTCEFTLTWRRHHCRACGKVVCQSCSSNKHCLEYLKNQLARVCDQCFLVLQQQKSEQTLSAAVSPNNRAAFAFSRKQKKIPAALKEVTANTDNSSMSGYLQRLKGNKKQGKRLWFVIKDKVLYTYAASEDVAALESQPLLGFMLKVDPSQKQQFKLYHKNTLYYIFKADDVQTAQRWIESFRESMVL